MTDRWLQRPSPLASTRDNCEGPIRLQSALELESFRHFGWKKQKAKSNAQKVWKPRTSSWVCREASPPTAGKQRESYGPTDREGGGSWQLWRDPGAEMWNPMPMNLLSLQKWPRLPIKSTETMQGLPRPTPAPSPSWLLGQWLVKAADVLGQLRVGKGQHPEDTAGQGHM